MVDNVIVEDKAICFKTIVRILSVRKTLFTCNGAGRAEISAEHMKIKQLFLLCSCFSFLECRELFSDSSLLTKKKMRRMSAINY